jgi:carboxymethylenebutenolidase
MQDGSNPWVTGRSEFKGADVTFAAADGTQIKGYAAAPSGGGQRAGVVVIHENRGLVPYIREVADGFASEGLLAIAPDLLTRDGGTDKFNSDDIPGFISGIQRDRHVGDVQGAVNYLRQQGATKVGVIGFCFGGGVTWLSAVRLSGVDAWAPFYGVNPPLEEVPNIKGRVLGVYADKDERINAGLPGIREALQKADIPHEIQMYPDSQHAFHNHRNPERYNAETARQAWQAAVGFFKKELG